LGYRRIKLVRRVEVESTGHGF